MTTHTIYQDIFNEQLGATDERIKIVIETIDSNGDGLYEAIKVTTSVFDEDTDGDGVPDSNSGTEDLIGVAFDIGDDSLISSLNLTIDDITLYSDTDPNTNDGVLNSDPVAGTDFIIGQDAVTGSELGVNISGGGEESAKTAGFILDIGNPTQDEPAIDVEKYVSIDGGQTWVDADTAAEALNIVEGTDVQFKVVVQNTGNVDLTNVILSDNLYDLNGDASGTDVIIPSLTSGSSETYIYTTTWEAGLQTNTATATSDQGVIDNDDGNYFGADPSIAIDKVTNGADGQEILEGTDVTWTYSVSNAGNVGISNVSVTDDNGTVNDTSDDFTPTYVSGDTDGDNILDVGETWTYEASGTSTAGEYSNLGTVTGNYTDDLGNTENVTDDDPSNYFGADPSIAIDKVTNGADGQEILEGTDVTWTYTVNNTGNVGLSNVNVSDDQGVVVNYVSGDTDGDNVLDTTETWIYEGTGTAIAGDYSNIGTVTGDYTDNLGNSEQVTDDDPSNYFGADPSIAIDKVTNGADGQEILEGTDVTWTYTVNNTGNVGLSNVNVSDDQGVVVNYVSGDTDGDGILDTDETLTGVDTDGDGVLDTTETWIYEGTGTAVAGDYSNIGTVTGDYTDNWIDNNGDGIEQTTELQTVDRINDALADWQAAGNTGDIVLNPGEAFTFDYTTSYAPGELNPWEDPHNTIIANGTDDEGNETSDNDQAVVDVFQQNQRSIEIDSLTGIRDGDMLSGNFRIVNASGDPVDVKVDSLNMAYEEQIEGSKGNKKSWTPTELGYSNQFWLDDNQNGLLDSGETELVDLDPSTTDIFETSIIFGSEVYIGYKSTFDSAVPDPIRATAEATIDGRFDRFGEKVTFHYTEVV